MKHLYLFIFAALLISSCLPDNSDTIIPAVDQAMIDDSIIMEHISTSNLLMDATEEGIYYSLSNPGNSEHPTINDNLTVDYKGYFLDGEEFDSGNNIDFELNAVIQGWQLAMPLLGKGGSGTFIIPSGLAYGPWGSGPIPPNTVLIFDVTLHDFN